MEEQPDLINVYKCLMRGKKEDGAILFSAVSHGMTRVNGHKLTYRIFYLNAFTVKIVTH